MLTFLAPWLAFYLNGDCACQNVLRSMEIAPARASYAQWRPGPPERLVVNGGGLSERLVVHGKLAYQNVLCSMGTRAARTSYNIEGRTSHNIGFFPGSIHLPAVAIRGPLGRIRCVTFDKYD